MQAECCIGRCYEKLGRPAEALEQYYLKVVLRYFEERKKGSRLNESSKLWFSRAAFYAVDILEAKKDWRRMVRLLERVDEAGVPAAEEARERIKKIKSEHFWLFY